MAQHGGYRKPTNPAPVSGPGALSRRTDGRPGTAQSMSTAPDQPYGDQTQQMNEQRIAPMAGKPEMPPPPDVPATEPENVQGQLYSGGEFGAPTSRPNEPVTSGVPIGPGPGPSLMPNVNARPSGRMTQMLMAMSATDTTGVLASLLQQAQRTGT